MHMQLLRRRPTAWGHHLRDRASPNDTPPPVGGINNDGFTLSQPLTITIKNVPVPSQPGVLNPTGIVDSSTSTNTPVQPTSAAPSIPSPSPVAQSPSDDSLSTTTSSASSSTSVPTTTGRPQVSQSNQALASKRLPKGTLAAIIVVSAVAALAVLIFFVRKQYIKNRRRKTLTWGAGILSKPISSADMIFNNTGPVSTVDDPQRVQRQPYDPGDVSPAVVAPPPMSYNNPVPPSVSGMHSPGLMSPTTTAATRAGPALPSSSAATVQCTFIPTLPDELSISTGEIVRVLGEYDDGWALCVNGKGEQGMVPLECLDRGDPAVRNSRRASSLLGFGGGAGGRYQY